VNKDSAWRFILLVPRGVVLFSLLAFPSKLAYQTTPTPCRSTLELERRFSTSIYSTSTCVKTNKCTNYSFSLLIMYGSSYVFRHHIAVFSERS
jgi:hypothetical protein